MSDYVFKIVGGNVILNEEAKLLTVHLKTCQPKDLLFIVIAYDYTRANPYHQKPLIERKNIALQLTYKKGNFDEISERLQSAIEEYNSLIYDPTRYTAEILKNKISILQGRLNNEDNVTEIVNIEKAIRILEERYEKTINKAVEEEEKIILKGNKSLSLIEKLKRNKRLYLYDRQYFIKEKVSEKQ